MASRIRKGDTVMVTAGKDRGKTGEVLKVLKEDDRVIVRGAQMVVKHVKPSQTSQGGLDRREGSIHISNVSLIDPEDNKAVRVGFRFDDDGRKVRYAKRSGNVIDR